MTAALFAALPHASAAQDQENDSIYAPCARIVDGAQRLACFDETYARERAVEAERAEALRRQEAENFGLTPAQIREREVRSAELGSNVSAGEPASERDEYGQTIMSPVSEVFKDSLDNYVVLLDNGQVWRSTSNTSWRGRIKPGWNAKIEKIWSGGYRLRFDEKRGYLGVTRLR